MTRRCRREPAVWMALTAAVVAVFGSVAQARMPFVSIVPISDGNAATDESARANTPINTVAFKRQSLTTVGGYQFTSYYQTDGTLVVGRRKQVTGGTGWSNWTINKTAFTSFNINDSHNTSTLGIDGDGVLHIAWGLHNNVMQYTRSTASVLNDNTFTLTGQATGNNTTTGVLANEIPLYNQSITYPEFYNVPGTGDLMLGFRTGASGNGDAHLVRWNNTSNAWQGVRVGTSQDSANPFIDNDYGSDSLPNASPYLNSLAFDSTGKLHVSWTYRYGSDSPSASPHFSDYQTNHNFMYAVSDPNDASGGGYTTWRKQNGTLYARNGQHDIDENNAQVITSIPEGSSLINQAAMTIDNQDRPVIASWWAPQAAQGNHLRQYMLAWYDGAAWKTSQVSNRNAENGNARVAESQLGTFNMSRPIVLVDEDDRVLVVYSDWQRGNVISVSYTDSPLRDSWQTIDLTSENSGGWEPSYDRNRWGNDGVLSMYYQPITGQTGTAPSIVEWDARAYFATTPGQIAWDVDADGTWSTATNWSTGAVPGGAGVSVRFGGAGTTMTATRTVDLGGVARTVGSLTLNGIGTNGFVLNNGTLAFDNAGDPGLVTVATGNHTIGASLVLGTSGTEFAVSATTSTVELAGSISGAGNLVKSGAGTLILSGTEHSYAQTTVTGGTLQVGTATADGALSSGPVIVTNGTLAFRRSGDFTVTNNIGGVDGFVRHEGVGTLTLMGDNAFGTGLGGVIVTNGGTLRRGTATAIRDGLALSVNNGGRLDLNGMDLSVRSLSGTGDGGAAGQRGAITDLADILGTSALVVTGSGFSAFTGVIANGPTRSIALTKSGAGTLVLSGPSTFTGGTTFTRGFVTADNSSAFGTGALMMSPTASTAAADATRLTLNPGVTISNALVMNVANSGVAAGSLQVISGNATYAGSISIHGNALTGGHFAGGTSAGDLLRITGSVTADTAVSSLIVRQGRVSFAGGGSYGGLDVRADTTFVGATNGIATNALVDIGGNASATLDLNGFDQTLRGLKNAVNGSNAAVVTNTAGTTRTLTLLPQNGDTQSFGGSIRGNLLLRITGDGTQVLTKTGTTSQNGVYDFASAAVIDGVDAILQLKAAAFNIALTNASGVDIRDGRLSFDFSGGGTNPKTTVLGLLDAGYDLGFATGRLRSSTAASARGLGWKEVVGSQVIVMATFYGDATLDGTVGFDDLVVLAQNYDRTSGATWADGDANYNGAVEFSDLVALAQNYNQSTLGSLEGLAGGSFASDWALAQSLVPEPASMLGVLSVLSASVSRRRRRCRLSSGNAAISRSID
jgi:autotransporter-associated beta strand protein